MDVRIRERLVGALVLVAVIVLLVPAVLKGTGTAGDQPKAQPTKGVEIDLGVAAAPGESESLVPEPEITQANAGPAAAAPAAAVETAPPAQTAAAEPQASQPAVAAGPLQPAATEPSAWAVQLGAFSSRSKAEGLVTQLRSRGYSAFVLEYRAGGQLLHRVRVGPEQDRARAVAIAERLRKDGFQPVVAPHP